MSDNEVNNLKKENVNIYSKVNDDNKGTIINNIKMNICCYYCLSKKTNMDVNLLEEGMKLLTRRLDIMNIFTRIYQDEILQKKLLKESLSIPMSKSCIYNIDIIKKEKEVINEVDDG